MTQSSWQVLCSGLGMLITAYCSILYIVHTLQGKTKPHAFSWLIWSILAGIGFAGQFSDGGGYGAWVSAFSMLCSAIVFVLALITGERHITRFDWICLLFALVAIVLWQLTETPLYSMIMVSAISASGFLPTIRKTYTKPFEETLIAYAGGAVVYVLALFAMSHLTWITVIYPTTVILVNVGFVTFMLYRRAQLKTASA